MKRIVTHADPDLDAIVSAWIAQDFLFQAHESEVLFVNRKVPETLMQHADCLVDVGNVYCPENYRFDHKPPHLRTEIVRVRRGSSMSICWIPMLMSDTSRIW